jgi:hypothetical protein
VSEEARTRNQRPRAFEIIGRFLAAIAGGYGVAWAYAVAASLMLARLGFERSDAVAWATLTSYAVMLTVFIAAFAIRSWLLVCALLFGMAIAFGGASLLMGTTLEQILRGA